MIEPCIQSFEAFLKTFSVFPKIMQLTGKLGLLRPGCILSKTAREYSHALQMLLEQMPPTNSIAAVCIKCRH